MIRLCLTVMVMFALLAPLAAAQWADRVLMATGVTNPNEALGANDAISASIPQWRILWLEFDELIEDKNGWDVRVFLPNNTGHKKGDVAILICDNGRCASGVVDVVSDALGFGFVADFSGCTNWKKGHEVRIENKKKTTPLPVDAVKVLQLKGEAAGGKDWPPNPDDDCLVSGGVPALTGGGLIALGALLLGLGTVVIRRRLL